MSALEPCGRHLYTMLSLRKSGFVDGHCRAVSRKVRWSRYSVRELPTQLSEPFRSTNGQRLRGAVLDFATNVEGL